MKMQAQQVRFAIGVILFFAAGLAAIIHQGLVVAAHQRARNLAGRLSQPYH